MRKVPDDRWLLLILCLYAFGIGVWPLTAGIEVTVEDGYYYLKIAENVVGGRGSTFDGEHPTNGYHPLWLLSLLPVVKAASSSVQALALAKLLQAALAALTAMLLYRVARTLAGRGGAAVAVLIWVELTHRLWLQGLETALHALILTAALGFYLRHFNAALPRSDVPFLLLGSGCALTFLTRLDAWLLAGVLGVALLVASGRAGFDRLAARRLAAFAAPVAITVLAYVAFNLLHFGHPLPVSAEVKRDWSATLLQSERFYLDHGWFLEKGRAFLRPLKIGWGHPDLRPLAFGLTAIFAWLGTSVSRRRQAGVAGQRRGDERPVLRPLVPWACYGVLSYLVYVLLYHRGLILVPRYYVVQPIVGALIVALALDRFAERFGNEGRRRRVVLGAAAVVLIALTAWGNLVRFREAREGPGQPLINAALWTIRELPATARIASWNSGTIAFLAGRQVVNLDGLVNSWEFYENDRQDLCGYWRRQGITHLVDLFRNGESQEEILPMAPVPIGIACRENLELLWLDERYDPAWSVRAYRLSWGRSPRE